MPLDVPHPSFVFLGKILESYTTPSGDFDPEGEWKLTYYLVVPLFNSRHETNVMGQAELERRPEGTDGLVLSVSSDLRQEPHWLRLRARARCARDELSSLRSWERTCVLVDADGQPDPGTLLQEETTLESWKAARKASEERMPLTSDWTLIDALQRRPSSEERFSGRFELLEDFQVSRGGQRVEPLPPVEARLGGERTRLHGYVRTGRGTLPVHYWLDEKRRVLFVIGSLRALVLVEGS